MESFVGLSAGVGLDYVWVKTLEGVLQASKGDYIIKGIKGEIYPCKPDIFEATYEKVGGIMDFGTALVGLKSGLKMAREGWNGKGMFIYLATPNSSEHLPYIVMKTADNKLVPWLASQTDVLAEDWVAVEE
jgi:hypothetical protein